MFGFRKDALLDKLIDLVKLQGAKLATLEKEVELINGKLRKKIYKEPDPENEDGEINDVKDSNIDDGLNSLRGFGKSL